jgi:hypothetical protein
MGDQLVHRLFGDAGVFGELSGVSSVDAPETKDEQMSRPELGVAGGDLGEDSIDGLIEGDPEQPEQAAHRLASGLLGMWC